MLHPRDRLRPKRLHSTLRTLGKKRLTGLRTSPPNPRPGPRVLWWPYLEALDVSEVLELLRRLNGAAGDRGCLRRFAQQLPRDGGRLRGAVVVKRRLARVFRAHVGHRGHRGHRRDGGGGAAFVPAGLHLLIHVRGEVEDSFLRWGTGEGKRTGHPDQ